VKERKPTSSKKRPGGRTPRTANARKRLERSGTRPKRPVAVSEKSPETAPAVHRELPVVAVGASAGGLEAFTKLLENLPPDTGMAFVLIQHLDPTHASMLPEILPRSTKMPVVSVRDGLRIESNRVYVIPSASRATLVDGTFRLEGRNPKARELPIDVFFRSIAENHQHAGIGVILSGTLSDGALGLKAIKAEGGITFVQDEASAKFPAMPRAAIALGPVDFVLPPDGIARELARIGRELAQGLPLKSRDPRREASLPVVARSEEPHLRQIFEMIRKATDVDFAAYRPTTVRRRIARRMLVTRAPSLEHYVRYLTENPAEIHLLHDDILITVTGFFRDPELFDALKATVFPAILNERSAKNPVRIWVPGCSTGEEVYSIAISLFEYMGEARINPPVQIFATDVSESAIERARNGVYAENALGDVSKERLRRFFVKMNGTYRVGKVLRDACVFARQNVAADPPFSNLDLLSCRNLLIYLEPVLQKRIVPLFHYALKPTGFLVLGRSETLTTFPDLFAPVDRNHRIFTKRAGVSRAGFDFVRHPAMPSDPAGKPELRPPAVDPQREADRLMLNRYSPPGVVVNESLDIVQFRGKTSPYLESASGAPSLNLMKMSREGLLVELRSAVLRAKRSGQRVRAEGIRVRDDGKLRTVDVEVVPIQLDADSTYYLIVFEEPPDRRKAPARKPGRQEKPSRQRRHEQEIFRLEQELTVTKDYLQAIVEEQEAANEELTSANEEILSSNEELQSTNEELETAKEELQSANEELTTVNEELTNRSAEVGVVNSDLLNLLSSINIAIVMVGMQGQIRRFTPLAGKLLNIVPTDLSRPINDLRPNFEGADLAELVAEAVETVRPIEREVRTREGKWYALQVRPYRTLDNRIDGAVILLHDIDPLKRTIAEANRSRDYAEALVETMRESLIVLDRRLRVRTANRAFYERFQISPINTEGKSLLELGGGWSSSTPSLRSMLEQVTTENKGVRDHEFEIELPHVGRKTLVASARPVRLPGESETLVLVAVEDVTEVRRANEELRSSETRYRRLFETAREAIWLLDGETGEILDVNPFAANLFGFGRQELIGKKPWDLPLYSDVSKARNRFRETVRAGYGFAPDVSMLTRDGRVVRVEKISSVYTDGNRTIVQSNIRDMTERLRLEDELRHAQKMESIGRLAGGIAHDFNNILNIISAYSALLSKGGDAKKRAQSTEAIEKAVQRGAALVRQLLTFARKETIKFEPVDVNSVVAELASMIAETFPRSVRIALDLSPEIPRIQADPSQLHQALLNLAVNARDAMPEGGTLEFTTRVVPSEKLRGRFPDAREDRYVCVGVNDEGKGMDEETRKRIFEPFFTTKPAQDGSGLGLAVVYGVANSHGGFVEVASESGKGSYFSLYLPLGRTESEGRDEPGGEETASPVKGENETILVVEDEELLLDSMKSLIESEGYRVLSAKDGVEAVQLYERHRDEVAVVFADLGLPRLGGWEAFLEMRRINPSVRAIFASGTIDMGQRALMRREGVELSVRKPFTATEMLGAIRRALRPSAGH
jgi:two-component system, chemotaxis family, CheB/CheR fusion protein